MTAGSETGEVGERRRGGRARDPELDEAITKATKELLEQHGVGGLTIEAVARRAGVGRATIYRRWPNRDALLAHLLRRLVREHPIPDRGDVREDLIEFLSEQLDFLQSEAGRTYHSLGAHAGVDSSAGEALWDIVLRRRDALLALLKRGIERQQLRSDFDIEFAYYLIWGPVYYRYLGAVAGHLPIERDFIIRLVDNLLLCIGIPQNSATRARRRARTG